MKKENPMSKRKPKTKVSRLTVSRLYNLGNYEHIRYEITADVSGDESAAAALIEIKRVLVALKPIRPPYGLEEARNLLKKDQRECTEQEKAKFGDAVKTVGTHEALLQRQWDAVKQLDEVGGASLRKDAKKDWDDVPF